MTEAIPESVKPLLDDYLRIIDARLPGFMEGFYLHGSIALEAFQAAFSDIDFVAVISRRCTRNDLEQLSEMHRQLEKRYPQNPLQGSYFQWGDLGKPEHMLESYPCWHDGRLHLNEHQENRVTWWLLKTRGLALAGPEPAELDFEVDWDTLIDDMQHNLNTYWLGFTRSPKRFIWLMTDDGIQWAVLGVLRQFYTFSEQDITSKLGAGDYALAHLPARWQRIIQEALSIRRQSAPSLYPSRLGRAVEAVRFLKYVIDACNHQIG